MARRRNQKKHASVLIGLQRASERIAPIKMVFDRDGALRKERDVNLPLSNDDLISGDSEPEDDIGGLCVAHHAIRDRSTIRPAAASTSRTSRRQFIDVSTFRRELHILLT